jgi:hypothetical protein
MEMHKQQSTSPHTSVLLQIRNEGKKPFWMAEGSTKQNRLTFYRRKETAKAAAAGESRV